MKENDCESRMTSPGRSQSAALCWAFLGESSGVADTIAVRTEPFLRSAVPASLVCAAQS